MNDVTVCVPSIAVRSWELLRALGSVTAQTELPDAISVALDTEHDGAARTRTLAVEAATTEWVALLDDDDELHPHHLERLFAYQRETNADLVFPWFDTSDNFVDPLGHEGLVWVPETPHMFPITVIVRRQLLMDVGCWEPRDQLEDWEAAGEDWFTWLRLRDAGAKVVHLNERTWKWNYTGTNTSGRGDRW